MADDTTTDKSTPVDSGHVVIPVLHPDGEVHDIAVPPDTPLADFHDALAEYYHQEPTADGAVENSEAFKQRAKQAWAESVSGLKPDIESGFNVDKTGTMGPLQTQVTPRGSLPTDKITVTPNTLGVLHTHPNAATPVPSPGDIAAAKASHKTIWLTSRNGLYAVDPKGNVTHVFKSSDWMKTNK